MTKCSRATTALYALQATLKRFGLEFSSIAVASLCAEDDFIKKNVLSLEKIQNLMFEPHIGELLALNHEYGRHKQNALKKFLSERSFLEVLSTKRRASLEENPHLQCIVLLRWWRWWRSAIFFFGLGEWLICHWIFAILHALLCLSISICIQTCAVSRSIIGCQSTPSEAVNLIVDCVRQMNNVVDVHLICLFDFLPVNTPLNPLKSFSFGKSFKLKLLTFQF